jgi:16S rRNA G966 N2-methylase RsmD
MKHHFVISYFGNKRKEVQHIHDNIDLNNIDTIIEPFCGTSAFSYFLSTLYPKKFKYILNDNNKILMDLYEILKNEQKTKEFETIINDKAKKIISKQSYIEQTKNSDSNIHDWFIYHKIYTIRPGIYNLNYIYKYIDINKCDIVNFLRNENVQLLNDDSIKIMDIYKNKKNVLIFLDPPYLLSCNQYYDNLECKNTNIYEYLYNYNINKMKSKIILCLEQNWIINLLFKNNKHKIIFDKKYQTDKRTVKYILIKNFA